MKSRALYRWFLAVGLSACLSVLPQIQAEVFYENPVVAGDHPDPSIIRVGKDYWATSTSSEWGPQFMLLHSVDLVNWEVTGEVFPHRPAWAKGNFWAPEIAQYKGKYYIYYVGHQTNGPLAVAVATSDKPSGPYIDHGPMVSQPAGSIDPVPMTDEKGDRYLVWKEDGNSRREPTIIWAQRMTDDGLKLTGKPKELMRNDASWEGNLVEGPFIVRRGDWFYLFYSGSGCCGTGCNYAMGVARSHSLLGPWEKSPANPILTDNERWKCPGHGSIVTDERGRYWLMYHAYAMAGSVFTGREALLDEVKFGANDWPTINDGKGPSARAVSPFGMAQGKTELSFSDEFKGDHLLVDWQWPQDLEPKYKLRDGHLVLASLPERGTNIVGAVLARSTTTANYTATTSIDTASLKSGSIAGLSAFGDAANAVGLAIGNGKLILWRRDKGRVQRLSEVDAPPGDKLQLRLTAKEGYRFQFAASGDSEKWVSVGDDLLGKNLPPWDRSIRVALTVGGNEKAEGRFDSFRLTPIMAGAQ
ncbi:MAG: beta-xylosidase [Pedosphaera sp.]|nr:beta-xylosidase [Pedosphaera sp.]